MTRSPACRRLERTAPDLPPAPSQHGCVGRDHEYVRHGTLSLLAGIDLLTGAVHASVEERHRSREFVAFPQKLDPADPPATAVKLILDNHSMSFCAASDIARTLTSTDALAKP